MDDIFTYLVDLPPAISEMVTPCAGGYTIYLNARLSYEDRVRAYDHALRHIERDDWTRSDVNEIELATH